MKLRDYQEQAITSLRRSLSTGHRRPILQAPTGSGKTHIAAAIVQMATEKDKRVLFLAPRRELIYQAAEKLKSYGVEHGLIMAGEPGELWATVQVASFDTLWTRGVKSGKVPLPSAELVIVDEAHLSVAPTRKHLIQSYPDAVIVGLTATPARGDGRGLGEIYDDIVSSSTIRQLVDQGHLVPLRYFAPSKPDLEGLKTSSTGDYVVKVLAERVDKPKLIGDIVHNWMRLAQDKRTVVFCATRAHSRHVQEALTEVGVSAEHLDGETPLEERKAILERVQSGETQVLCNVFVASYGLDIPALECCVLARPTKNITLYLQTVGRVMRPAPGKTEAMVIDHAGAVDQHGFAEDDVPWDLGGARVVERKEKQKKERGELKEITCRECGHVFRGSRKCPGCGHEMIPPSKPVPVHEADLKEIVSKERKANKTTDWETKRTFFAELLGYAERKHYKPGWAAFQYREKFGVWPNDSRVRHTAIRAPTGLVMGWIQHQAIRRARR